MSATDTHAAGRLRGLLAAAATEPQAQVAALEQARAELVDSSPVAVALDRAELDFLLAQERRADPAVAGRPAVAAARAAVLELELRCIAAAEPGDVVALFDLAELRASALHFGFEELAARAGGALADRIGQVPGGEALHQEALERYAALQTAEEDLELGQRIHLLRESSWVLEQLGRRCGDKRLRRYARRLRAAAVDRELQARLQRLLGVRGADWLERTSLVLLVVVLGLVLLDLTVDWSPGASEVLLWIDGLICSCFIAEFALKLALAPERWSWFLRNAATDLLPAIPAVFLLLPAPPGLAEAGDLTALRALRLFRITWAARYVQALRPVLRLVRLFLLLVRGMDGLMQRFQPLLNRDLVFFGPAASREAAEDPEAGLRALAFTALRREHALVAALPAGPRAAALERRALALAQRAAAAAPAWSPAVQHDGSARDVPVETAIEFLYRLRPEDVGRWLARADLSALDRVVRVLSAPVVRALPVARRLCVRPLPATASARVAAAGRRVAEWLERWQRRLLFAADLHGIVTGPQILDRFATTLVTLTQRPAVRLLLFGGMFLLLQAMIGRNCLTDIVGLPLVILGSVCLVLLAVGWWLKRVAGEAADAFRLTSEAHFVSLLELVKVRHEAVDLAFLARRVFRWELPPERTEALLRSRIDAIRAGAGLPPPAPELVREEMDRVALLYLHFLDGGILHVTDIKTTEQLLANLSLENIRHEHLGFTRRDRKRLRRLRLDSGSLFAGPYLWFRFITESVAVETAKRITEYNRRCLTLDQQRHADAGELLAMREWLESRRDAARGRSLEKVPPPGGGAYRNTRFNALDFLSADPDRDAELRELFGGEIADTLRSDRRNMIRQVFGTRPLHLLPKSRRSFNAWRFYGQHLSHGRAFLVPVWSAWLALRWTGWLLARLLRIVREVLRPELAMQRRENGEAPFAVALRKINRMKAPGLLEAIHTRVRFDPAFCGAASGWTGEAARAGPVELERDLDFLSLPERQRAGLLDLAARMRARVREWQAKAGSFEHLWPGPVDAAERRDGELAVTVAWATDRAGLRTLLDAPRWLREDLPRLLGQPQPGHWYGDLWRAFENWLDPSPVELWLRGHQPELRLRWRQLVRLRRAHAADQAGSQHVLAVWNGLPRGMAPEQRAEELLGSAFRERSAIRRELAALRAIQSLSVLDIRNYRDLVFRLGEYAQGGEAVASDALP